MTASEAHFGPVTTRLAGPIARIRLEDRDQRNRVGPAMVAGLAKALAFAAADDAVKVVVLHGLPEVFCAGAPREDLLGLNGSAARELLPFARYVAQCPIPVVAAAQGHALGGGLLLTLYCDIAVLSERSRYAANFLSYGFTPYGGTTYLLRAKLGGALGTEMVLTGRSYRGRELAERGAGVSVVAHESVPETAERIARRVAAAPRRALELIKSRFSAELLDEIDTAMRLEYDAHVETIASADARRRITRLYPPEQGAEEG